MSERHILKLHVVAKRSGQRVAIELSDGETIEIAPEIVVRRGLTTGAAINEETIADLRREDEALRARRRLTGYLALRVKSVADARLYLEKAGYSQAAIAAAVEDATTRGMLDDRRFAERYVRTKTKASALGPLRLVAELISHGIEPSLAEQIVEPHFDRDRQRHAAEKLARKLLRAKSVEDEEAVVKRLYEALKRRGFEEDIARNVGKTTARHQRQLPTDD